MSKPPLSPYARIFYTEWKLDPGRSDYNIVLNQRFESKLDIPKLENAIKRFILDYIILNSHVENREEKLYWVKNSEIYRLEYFKDKLTQKDILAYIQQPFNLEKGPLCRFGLLKESKKKYRYRLIIVLHHIIIDNLSADYLFKELTNYYNDQGYQNSVSLAEQLLNITNLSKKLEKQVQLIKEQSKLFWQKRLTDVEPVDLRFLRFRTANDLLNNLEQESKQSIQELSKIGEIRFSFNQEVLSKLNQLSKKYDAITPYLYGQSIYAILINRYTWQNTFAISSLVMIKGAEDFIYGAQINTNIIPYDFTRINNILDVIYQSKEFLDLLRDNKHSYLPIPDIISASNKDILNLSFASSALNNKTLGLVNTKSYNDNINIDLANYLSFEQEICQKEINYRVKYKSDKINTILLSEFIACYKRLFIGILDELDKIKDLSQLNHIKNYNIFSHVQYKQIIDLWNQTDKDYLGDRTIHELFEEQVYLTPDNIAVVYEDTKLTYKELNDKVNQLANYLRQNHNIKPDTLVALCIDRSEYMLIAILSVLKAGGAYVPMDPKYPDERIRYILEDAKIEIVLTNEAYKQRLENLANTITKTKEVSILEIDNDKILKTLIVQSLTNPTIKATSTNLAYVIYTSGTTGNPKGVMIEHKAYIATIDCIKGLYFTDRQKIRTYSTTNYVFDIFGLEYGLPLLSGGIISVGTDEFGSLDCSNFDFIQMTPSLGDLKLDYLINIENTKLIIGGESLSSDLLNSILNKSINIINAYGPTETTIWSTSKLYSNKGPTSLSYVSLGKPFNNEKVYVLDKNLMPLPIGAIGELYIGGVGLARGYLNRPELTAEKFIANPFQSREENKRNKNERLYKTGDLVRWLPDGNLEYLGRNDFQVKIGGYRIELGEIEVALLSYKDIRQSVVLAKEHKDIEGIPTGSKYLVAYYVKELNLQDLNVKDFIKTWEAIYQSEYSSLDINNFKQNTDIWISSYTGEAIVKEDMLEWVIESTKRIKELKPKVILEIGSGSGLLLFNIIDDCDYYYATDFSKNVIDYTNKVINKFGYNNKVTALCCAADELPYHKLKNQYDTVVINAVTMHFPNIDYLESVIIKAISNMKGSGQIFIGDVRDYRLLKCFHYSIQNYKYKKVTKVIVDYFARRDKELLVSPEYFINLKALNQHISYVDLVPKHGKASNEMNDYRYDVILHINKDKDPIKKKEVTKIHESYFTEVVDFENYFISNIASNCLYIKYPNKRIMRDYTEYSKLYGNELIINKDNNILSVHEILAILDNNSFKAKFLVNIHDPLYLYVIIYKDDNQKEIKFDLIYTSSNISKSELASNPLVSLQLLENQFAQELREYLYNKFPQYMVPQYYIRLEQLPLTTNNKLDRRALPDPEFTNEDNYLAPRNEVEQKICQIWAEVLGLDAAKVGIRDDFFRLGGNSISAIRLATKLNKKLDTDITLLSIFKYKTISHLAHYLKYNNTSNIDEEEYEF